jgi:SAM-dependent methyltransferase
MSEAAKTARYYPQIFATPDLDAAKRIILTDEGPGADTETRWQQETPYVLELIRATIPIGPDTLLLDYGCGIGRMSKALIDATGCSVIGLDTSPDMLRLSHDYVGSPRFLPMVPAQFDRLVAGGLRVDGFIAVWVLQHCLHPDREIARIKAGSSSAAQGFVLNMPNRAVPAVIDGENRFVWAGDGIDVAALLREAFDVTAEGLPDPTRTPVMAQGSGALWMGLRQRT